MTFILSTIGLFLVIYIGGHIFAEGIVAIWFKYAEKRNRK